MNKIYLKCIVFVLMILPNYSHAVLVSHYQAEGNALDSAGMNDGINNFVNYVPGKIGQAFDCNGSQSFIEVADDPTLDISTTITLSAWINPRTAGATDGVTTVLLKGRSIIDNYSDGQSYGFLWIGQNIIFRLFDGVSFYGLGNATINIPFNTFTHIAGTHDGNVMKLYIDGIEVNSRIIGSISIANSPGKLRIGKGGDLGASQQFNFQGLIDDVRIYDHVLTDLEIFKLAHITIFKDGFE
jgi:hypothetical protein